MFTHEVHYSPVDIPYAKQARLTVHTCGFISSHGTGKLHSTGGRFHSHGRQTNDNCHGVAQHPPTSSLKNFQFPTHTKSQRPFTHSTTPKRNNSANMRLGPQSPDKTAYKLDSDSAPKKGSQSRDILGPRPISLP